MKFYKIYGPYNDSGSLPVRERGLKFNFFGIDYMEQESLPVRERGLK